MISPYELIGYMVTNETVSARIDEETKAQMTTLAAIMDRTVDGKACSYA